MFVGHILLKKLNIKNIITINSMGKNRIRVSLKSAFEANNLVKNKMLEKEKLRAFIPNHLVERKGIIRSVDTFFDETYIKENIECISPIVGVKRMQRKVTEESGAVKFVPRQAVIATSFEGNILPKYVTINSVHFTVEPFISRVVQCLKYGHIGHVYNQCRGTKTLCLNCGKEKLEHHRCEPKDTYCIFCNINLHNSTSNKCPKYEDQKKVRTHMSLYNVPFLDAKNNVENLFSTIANHNPFNVLNIESEFQPPPNPTTRTKTISLSQPSTSSMNSRKHLDVRHTPILQSNKKRKIENNPVAKSNNNNMFPFRFGPDNPLPPNPYNPIPSTSDNSDDVIVYFNNCMHSLFKNMDNNDNLRNVNINQLKSELVRILEDVLGSNDTV